MASLRTAHHDRAYGRICRDAAKHATGQDERLWISRLTNEDDGNGDGLGIVRDDAGRVTSLIFWRRVLLHRPTRLVVAGVFGVRGAAPRRYVSLSPGRTDVDMPPQVDQLVRSLAEAPGAPPVPRVA